MPQYILDQTIFFLRPTNEEAIAILHAPENVAYRFEVPPPVKPKDQLLGETFDEGFASSGESGEQLLGKMSEVAPQTHNSSNPVVTESCRDTDQIHPFAFRFGFDSVENPSPKGFAFGDAPECDVQLLTPNSQCHFRIHYVFKSGALLITADKIVRVCGEELRDRQSLVLTPETQISCAQGTDATFLVEFPDINHCVELHQENYRQYSLRCNIRKASYMQTITNKKVRYDEYVCGPVIGRGGFGTVWDAINMNTGRRVALKTTLGQPSIKREVEIMRKLCHVSYNLLI